MDSLSLQTGPAAERADWERLAAAVLRKAGRLGEDDPDSAVWAALTHRTLDDIEVSPLGTPALLEGLDVTARPPVRDGGWDVRVLVADPDAAQANADALTDLENGATSLWLRVGEGGVPVEQLDRALRGVLLDAAPVVLHGSPAGGTYAAAQELARLAGSTRLADGSNLGCDPVGVIAAGGTEEQVTDQVRPGACLRIAEDLGARAFVVDGTVVHDRGASDAQEIGYVLAAAADCLRQYESHGLTAADGAAALDFRVAVSDDQFTAIAKLRAVRRLWARMLELSEVPEDQRVMRLHAVTSRPMMSKYDPWVNMLRGTVAAFAAGVGGADAITVLPFDSPLGVPDRLGRRIARNTGSLLIEESHIAAVSDPAGGSFLVERLTADLADAGWAELGRLDADGDVRGALPAFWDRVQRVTERRQGEIATRKRPITGLSEFPHLTETLPERRPGGDADGVRRYGAAFEEMRDHPPGRRVFLATMGPVAMHTARATFATSLLAAGGIAVDVAGATADADELVAAYDGQPVVCLAGHDKTYAEWGEQAVARLREAGAGRVIIAGRPGDLPVDDACAVGVDALEFLTRTREALS